MSRLRIAQRSQVKLKLALSGLSGAGKTWSALHIARGMVNDWSDIGLIDSENGSGELYSHFGPYKYLDLRVGADGTFQRDPHSPESYIAAIKEMYAAGVKVIILDSITHEWDGIGGCLESVERLGGRFSDWAKVTPRHKAFLDCILHVPAHVIATMRRKTDYTVTQEDKKQKIDKVGLKEIQREGIEYEFTVQFSIDRRHYATAEKDRTGMFRSDSPFKLDSEVGKQLLDWANGAGGSGAKSDDAPRQRGSAGGPVENESKETLYAASSDDKRVLVAAAKSAGITDVSVQKKLNEEMMGLPISEMDAKIAAMKQKLAEVKGSV